MPETVVFRAEPRPVQYISMERKKDPIFAAKPVAHDFTGAQSYLGLIFPADVVTALIAKLKSGKVTQARANDIIRATRRNPVDDKDPGVQNNISKIKNEEELPPILLIQGDQFRGIPLIVADGWHRVSAIYLRDPDAEVSCVLATVDWSALEAPHAKP